MRTPNLPAFYGFKEHVRKALGIVVLAILIFGLSVVVRGLLAFFFAVGPMRVTDIAAFALTSLLCSYALFSKRFHIENLFDAVVSPQRYFQMKKLQALDLDVLASADQDELLSALFRSLRDPTIGFDSFTLLLKDSEKGSFSVCRAYGPPMSIDGATFPDENALLKHLVSTKKVTFRERLPCDDEIEAEWVARQMDELHADVCFPLFSRRRNALFGVVAIGGSRVGYSAYVGRNLFWLKTVIEHVGILLDNFYHSEKADALAPFVATKFADSLRKNKDSQVGPKGARVWACILMIDIRRFTTLSRSMDAQQVVEMLEDYRTALTPLIEEQFGGVVDKFIGDAIMAVFGLPMSRSVAEPDLTAVACAVEALNSVDALNNRRSIAGKEPAISVGIGVSSGEVIACSLSAGDRRMEYTVIGDAVNLVARLEDEAGAGEILLAPETSKRVRDSVELKPAVRLKLQGYEVPVEVCAVALPPGPRPREGRGDIWPRRRAA